MKTSAVFGGVALMALLTMASVHAHKQTLLETQLVDEDVVTKTGKKIPVSQLYKTGENIDEFPEPSDPRMNLKSPSKWQATFNTNVGSFKVNVYRDWAPRGADRFYSLVQNDFYDGARFFRYADNFVVQWGLKGTPHVDKMYMNNANIKDDPFKKGNSKGRITFATSGTDTRSTQVFVNLADNHFLDSQGFTPFGELASEEDMEVFKKKINAQYGEKADQNKIIYKGNQLYLQEAFPHMSYIKTEAVTVLEP